MSGSVIQTPSERAGDLSPASSGSSNAPLTNSNETGGIRREITADTPTEAGNRFRARQLQVLIFAIAAYCVVSLSVVYFNWWFFTSGFKYPVFISWLQQAVGFAIFYIGAYCGRYMSSWRKVFPPPDFKSDIAKSIVPLSISFVLTIGFSNICLQRTLLSTYQVARSLTLFFVILLSYLILHERQSLAVILSCTLLVGGFIIGSLDPSTLSFGGLLAGGLSSFFQALYNVLIKYSLPRVQGDNQMLLFYNVWLSSIFFLPMVLIAEGVQPFKDAFGFSAGVNLWMVWGGICLSGVLGTSLNMTQYLLIQTTTPLSFNIIGFMKALVQSLGGIVIFGDPVTPESALGLTLSSVGSACYTRAKHVANSKKVAEAIAREKAEEVQETATNEANFRQQPAIPLEHAIDLFRDKVTEATPDTLYPSSPQPNDRLSSNAEEVI